MLQLLRPVFQNLPCSLFRHCNRCVIEVFGGVFYVVTLLFGFFFECRAVVIGPSQISSFLSFKLEYPSVFSRFCYSERLTLFLLFLKTLMNAWHQMSAATEVFA